MNRLRKIVRAIFKMNYIKAEDNSAKVEAFLKTLDNSGMSISRQKIERSIEATKRRLANLGVTGNDTIGTQIIVSPRFVTENKKEISFSYVNIEKFKDGWYITGGKVISGSRSNGDVFVITVEAHNSMARVYSI